MGDTTQKSTPFPQGWVETFRPPRLTNHHARSARLGYIHHPPTSYVLPPTPITSTARLGGPTDCTESTPLKHSPLSCFEAGSTPQRRRGCIPTLQLPHVGAKARFHSHTYTKHQACHVSAYSLDHKSQISPSQCLRTAVER